MAKILRRKQDEELINKEGFKLNRYISDTHFGHSNIIRYDNRPFWSFKEMDEALVRNWNETVNNADTVYILGDFSWYDEKETLEILNKLSGKKVLIKGNHDRLSQAVAKCFVKICDYLEITDNGTRVVMSHYPMLFWNGQFRDSVHLYGHIHNSHQWNCCRSWQKELRQLQDLPMRMYNVGCMMPYMDYTPKSLEEIIIEGEKYI